MNHNATRTGLAFAVLVASTLGAVGTIFFTSQALPPRVASHFDAAGIPDGWMSRAAYVEIMIGLTLGLTVFLLLVFFCIRYFPLSSINLPNREYWLGPAQRADTFGFILRSGTWLICANSWFLLAIHLLVVSANKSHPVRLASGVWGLGGVFAMALVVWAYVLIRRFSRI